MKTDLLHQRIEQDQLNEIQVFGYHDHHVNVSTFHKTLNGGLYTFVGYGVGTVPGRKGFFHKI